MEPPLALCIDLDRTLLDDDASYELSVRRTCGDLAASHPRLALDGLAAAYEQAASAYWAEVGDDVVRGRIDGHAVRREQWRRALAACGHADDGLAAAAASVYASHRRQTYALFEDARLLLQRMAGGLPWALITNGSADVQREKTRITGLDAFCDAVLVSGEVGVAKPDGAIFRIALERLDVAPRQVWHVGDSLTSDVAGALNAGLTAVWLNRSGAARAPLHPQPHLEVASLSELVALLRV